MKSLKILSLISLFICVSVFAEKPELVQQAMDAMETSSKTEWAYTKTTTDENIVTVERFDPSLEQKWTTLTINGKAVASDFEHPQHGVDEEESENDEDKEGDFSAIAQDDSWQLVSETDTVATYSFTPEADDPEEAKFLKHLQGTMLIDKQNPHIKKFSMKALRKFKPMAIVKVLNMQVDVEFADVGNADYKVIKESEDVTVRVALIKQREKSETLYSNYLRVDTVN